MAESRDSKFRKNPVNEEDKRQIGDDKIVLDNNVRVQIMRHNSSFFRGDNSWKYFHELNQEVIYIEDGSLNEKGEGGLRFEGKILIGEIYIAGGVYSKIGFGWRDKLAIYHLHLQGKSTIIFIAAGNSSR